MKRTEIATSLCLSEQIDSELIDTVSEVSKNIGQKLKFEPQTNNLSNHHMMNKKIIATFQKLL